MARSTSSVTRLSDDEVVAHAKTYSELKARSAALAKEAEPHRDAVIIEMAKRKTANLETAGVKVTVASRSSTSFSLDEAKKRLSRGVLALITRTAIDKASFDLAVKAGKIDVEDVDAIRTVADGTPYIVVSGEAA